MSGGGYNAAMTPHPIPILRSAAVRAVEAEFADVEPRLMERAGSALARTATQMCARATLPILIVAGPGNNGGDGLVAARLLSEQGHEVDVVFAGDATRLPADARTAHDTWLAGGGKLLGEIPPRKYALVIDALFGIGLKRPLQGRPAELIAAIASLACPVLAVDLPSGLDADTGRIMGSAVRADRTLTFIALKPGLLTLDGPDRCGQIEVADLNIPCSTLDGEKLSPASFRHCLRPRSANSHKGSFGSAGILGGAPGMAGAALLAGRAALKLGAGRVYVGMLERLAIDPVQPELMLRTADDAMAAATVIAVGPGLGRSTAAVDLLRRAIATDLPLVIDADGLNLVAEHPVLMRHIAHRAATTVLTPHPAEAARLLATSTEEVQADRLAAALELARRGNCLVILKGNGSIVANADGRWFINTTGNAGLASAGTGDVLTGMIVSLLAQGWPVLEATQAACHLHGAAADALAATGVGPVGLSAGELIDSARALLNRWIADA